MARHIAFLSFLLVVFTATFAFANQQDEAQKHFDDGAAYYFKKEYGKAIVEFMKGNDLYPNALFLYNISLCHSHLGNLREGIDNAKRAKSMGGLSDETNTQNDARIVALQTAQTAQSFEAPVLVIAPPDEHELTEDIQQEPSFGALGWVGVATTTAGVGLLGGALAVELSLQTKWDKYEKAAAAGDDERYAQLKTEIEDQQTTGLILLAAGAGVSIVGATLIIIELTSSEAPQPVVFVSPNGTGYVGLAGQF